MLIVLEIAPVMNGCDAAIMRMWLSTREIALAGAPAGVGAVEHGIVLALQMRRALQRHRAADMGVGGLDLAFAEAERGQQVEAGLLQLLGRDLQRAGEEIRAERPFVEDELDVEGARQRRLQLGDRGVGEALGAQASRY